MTHDYLDNISFLIVDDNAFMRTIVKRILGTMGVREIREAEDGAEALKILNVFAPDIIITDWVMEPIDGLVLTHMIRNDKKSENPFVPIIMLTAHSEMARITQARDTGVNEYIVKPVSVKALFSRIQSVIEKPRDYVKVGTYFGPDRRRKDVDADITERRTGTLPDEMGADTSMSQTDIDEFMGAEGKARDS